MIQEVRQQEQRQTPRPEEADPLYQLSAELAAWRTRCIERLEALADANTRPEMMDFVKDLERVTREIDTGVGQMECDLDAVSGTHRARWVQGKIAVPEAQPRDAAGNGR